MRAVDDPQTSRFRLTDHDWWHGSLDLFGTRVGGVNSPSHSSYITQRLGSSPANITPHAVRARTITYGQV